jgi:tRNA modification GTPase
MKHHTKSLCSKCVGFSNEIAKREELLNFASLIELELDFAGDVEFRSYQFHELLNRIEFVLKRLIDSFAVGNVIKTNSGRHCGWTQCRKIDTVECFTKRRTRHSFGDAGTTRDTIEDELVIGGISFDLWQQESARHKMLWKASEYIKHSKK